MRDDCFGFSGSNQGFAIECLSNWRTKLDLIAIEEWSNGGADVDEWTYGQLHALTIQLYSAMLHNLYHPADAYRVGSAPAVSATLRSPHHYCSTAPAQAPTRVLVATVMDSSVYLIATVFAAMAAGWPVAPFSPVVSKGYLQQTLRCLVHDCSVQRILLVCRRSQKTHCSRILNESADPLSSAGTQCSGAAAVASVTHIIAVEDLMSTLQTRNSVANCTCSNAVLPLQKSSSTLHQSCSGSSTVVPLVPGRTRLCCWMIQIFGRAVFWNKWSFWESAANTWKVDEGLAVDFQYMDPTAKVTELFGKCPVPQCAPPLVIHCPTEGSCNDCACQSTGQHVDVPKTAIDPFANQLGPAMHGAEVLRKLDGSAGAAGVERGYGVESMMVDPELHMEGGVPPGVAGGGGGLSVYSMLMWGLLTIPLAAVATYGGFYIMKLQDKTKHSGTGSRHQYTDSDVAHAAGDIRRRSKLRTSTNM